jgi:pimeloyl-ACP methyl ester carboxylesterase
MQTELITRYLDTAEGRIAFDDSGGDGPLLIALPGMGDLRGQYRLLRPLLVRAGWRVVTMDVRGQGESNVVWSDYSARAAGRDVQALAAHLGMRRVTVAGNSFAAGAALWAAHDSDIVSGAVLIGPVLRDMPVPVLLRAALRLGLAGPWKVWFWMTYWNSLFPLDRPDDHASYRVELARNLREPGRFAALKRMIALTKADTEAILDAVRVPVLVVMGTRDADFADPVREARDLAARLHGEMLLVDGAGHYPHVERPETVAEALLRFLRQTGG